MKLPLNIRMATREDYGGEILRYITIAVAVAIALGIAVFIIQTLNNTGSGINIPDILSSTVINLTSTAVLLLVILVIVGIAVAIISKFRKWGEGGGF